MSCLGAHFAITSEVAARLKGDPPPAPGGLRAFIDYLEQQYDSLRADGWVQSTELAWDAIHRCLTDGKLNTGKTPVHWCILGADERLWVKRKNGEAEWIVNLLEPSAVRQVCEAIRHITRAELRRGYDHIDPNSFYALNRSDDDFEYTWDHFERLRTFFERAATAERWVVFRVDQ